MPERIWAQELPFSFRCDKCATSLATTREFFQDSGIIAMGLIQWRNFWLPRGNRLISAHRRAVLLFTNGAFYPSVYETPVVPNIMNKNEVEGKGKQVKGKVREEVGKLTNNKKEQVKGKVEQAEGKVREAVGKAQSRNKNR
jgi:uncharacterized protein YjbJ (UPF0337 family)